MEYPTVDISLEEFPTTTGNTEYWSNYIRESEATLTTNDNKHVINKTYKIPDVIKEPTKYFNCKTDNNLVFSRPNLGLSGSILYEKMKKCDITK